MHTKFLVLVLIMVLMATGCAPRIQVDTFCKSDKPLPKSVDDLDLIRSR